MSRLTAAESLERLLVITPWVASHPEGVLIEDVADRFDIDPQQLMADLETLFMVGLHPFTPDTLIDVTVDEGRVWIRYADMFSRPKLTSLQALALLGSAQVLAAANDGGPLERGLQKLAAAIGIEPGSELDVRLEGVDPGVLAELNRAVAERRTVEIEYFAYNRNEKSRRSVDPLAVAEHLGAWYLSAWCHRAGGHRTFRLDRVDHLALTDQVFDLPAAPIHDPIFVPGDELPMAVIEIDTKDRWLVEQHPVEHSSVGEERLTLHLRIASPVVLQRLLLRAGPTARLVSWDGEGTPGREAAQRALTRYGGNR